MDSPLSQVKDSATRRYELLTALSNMSEYANNNGVSAIIVAGDLFDSQFATDSTVSSVAEIINRSKASWFVLQGNHGSSVPYVKLKNLVPKLNLFGNDWSYFNLGNVTICGRELGRDDAEFYAKLSLDPNRYNIMVLHGDVDDDSYGLIDRKFLAKCPLKYIALGHRHAFAQYSFGAVKACYCGVLEPRGFDEPERAGFVLADTDTNQITFVEQHIRRIQTVNVDVTGVSNDVALHAKIVDALSVADNRNYVNVVFTGILQKGAHLMLVAESALEGRFFALRLEDKTTVDYDLKAIRNEVSLRGEFVKLAEQIEDEGLRLDVIKIGLQALSGEDIK